MSPGVRCNVRRLLPLDPSAMENTGQLRCPAKAYAPIARQRCVEFQRSEGCTCPGGEHAFRLERQHQQDLKAEEALREAASEKYRKEYRANGADRLARFRQYGNGKKCPICGRPRKGTLATCGRAACVNAARGMGGRAGAGVARPPRAPVARSA